MKVHTIAGYYIETGFSFARPGGEPSSRDSLMLKVSKRKFDAVVKRMNELGAEFEIRDVYSSESSVETCLYSRGDGSRMAPRDRGLFVTV